MSIKLSGVDKAILGALQFGGVEGLSQLAVLISCKDVYYVQERMHRLKDCGLIEIQYPLLNGTGASRGHKVRIQRMNRNSPGYPRKR